VVSTLERVTNAIERQEGYHVLGSRAHRNKNPGNLKFGPFAKAYGADAKDDVGHAIFPTHVHGRRALKALLATKFKGKTLREIGKTYAEDPHWAVSVARIAGVNVDDVVVA
jgi:hypothetical protein